MNRVLLKNCWVLLTGILVIGWICPVKASDTPSLQKRYETHATRLAPRDAFAALENPKLYNRSEADETLMDQDWVIGFVLDGHARAYPVQTMGRHEIVNDRIDTEPYVVCW